ncbi:hypothetical protein C5B92_13880 [Rathayibacter sp. AY1A4]|uniref:hypothetical protein n=1 Tax=Rathayibacter sp. AY1A4 TaxID=2080522 RepID=UPI000CE75FF5|nr:hypothetical protein [Rathayibacter sp. AY1A4]PPF15274.1 hypothetical protein C5B92_13880 [Rathayibacter sp. AY1A4]
MRERAAEVQRGARDAGEVAGLAAGAVVVGAAEALPPDPVAAAVRQVESAERGAADAGDVLRDGREERARAGMRRREGVGAVGELGAGVGDGIGGGHPPSRAQVR